MKKCMLIPGKIDYEFFWDLDSFLSECESPTYCINMDERGVWFYNVEVGGRYLKLDCKAMEGDMVVIINGRLQVFTLQKKDGD